MLFFLIMIMIMICFSVEAYQSSHEDAMMESAEAAEALMNIDSSTSLALDEKQIRKCLHCMEGLTLGLFMFQVIHRLTGVMARRRKKEGEKIQCVAAHQISAGDGWCIRRKGLSFSQ